MNFFINIIISLFIGIVGSWIGKPLLKYLAKQNKKISNFIYTKLSFRKCNYGINTNIALIAMMILFGFYIPEQTKFENEIKKHKELSIPEKNDDINPDIALVILDLANITFIVIIYFIVLFYGVRIALSEIINKEVSEFERDLKMLKPTISKEEFEQLESLWAKIRSFEDFIGIKTKVQELKSKN
ncbi:hypothetical protein [Capnocytophaga sputigena]|uniref:hypothetical protein n=1 Tax=Capnocytophaga sputigena TaxID=1019 RepID=UPI0028ECFCE3|nr:hypothetical protein [Capnocytophaga sputigena]